MLTGCRCHVDMQSGDKLGPKPMPLLTAQPSLEKIFPLQASKLLWVPSLLEDTELNNAPGHRW
jgi:hypothetical protein